MKYDQIRTEYLESYGYKVIRFSNQEIYNHPEEVFEKLYTVIESYVSKL